MDIKIEYKPSPNFSELKGKVRAIVLHTTLGSYQSAVSWLRTSPEEREKMTGKKSYSSAHVVIGRNGEIALLIGFDLAAWHAGSVDRPSARAKKVLKRTLTGLENPNGYTIGIEFASGYDVDGDLRIEDWEKMYTPAQVKSAVWLLKEVIELAVEKEFTEDEILTHRDITSYKPNLELQRELFLAELRRVNTDGKSEVRASETAGSEKTEASPKTPATPSKAQPAVILSELIIDSGQRVVIENKGDKIHIRTT